MSPTDGGRDVPADLGGDRPPAPSTCDGGSARKIAGEACGCANECQSNFCVDGVCCGSACTDTCKACNVPGMVGTCSNVPSGLKPRAAGTCSMSDVATCGLDGTCDGQGACRKYPLGTTCKAGTCEGDAVVGINVCDGTGRCRPGAAKICAPFSCDANNKKDCFPTCTKNSDCVSGVECVNGSCGPKMRGASCEKNDECASGFCADKVCCSVACQGACVSCSLVGHEGTCWPVDQGNPDPRAVCKDSGVAACGETGACDGFGACAKYAAETVCIPPVCTGDTLATAGTCDGIGACRAPGAQNCPPFRCVNGACNTRCDSDADCQTGIACVNGSCGPKQTGQICTAASQCASGNCVDGVCCADACGGACRSCALPSSLGKCTPIPAGNSDPRNSCTDQGAASCGNDGKCDGAGACRKYRPGTVCGGEICGNNVYTGAPTCSATGQCVPPASRPCFPFGCNGQRCFDACTNNGNCVPPNVCNGNSCGKKMNGAACSNAAECASNQCFQGVCCGTTCNNACKSCALPGTEGTCTNVPAGAADPHNTCVDQGAASCGTNGRCAAGACQRYAANTSCKDPTCPGGTVDFTGRSVCDGAGKCVTPATTSCYPFKCGTNTCRSACTADADCASGAFCVNGSCGLRPKGSPCASTNECSTGLVCSAQNVCCNAACDGPCVSCTLSAAPGTCSPVPANQNDPNGKCGVAGAATCGNDGKCDGNGGCRKYVSGTQCVPPSCANGTLTLAKTCNGAGACNMGGSTRTCAPFLCSSATACHETCTSSTECVPPNTCVGNLCGKKPPGAACTAADQCAAGFCTDGVCCNSNGCGACKACNATGTCQNDDGMSCGSNDMCHVEGMCVGGTCSNPTISCDDNNPCTTDSCNPQTGCVHAALTGTSCGAAGDGNSCTTGDICQAGKCTGTPVTCQPPGQCHSGPGVCSPATGQCVYPNKPNNTACNDSNGCTTVDVCRGGACMGTVPVRCTADMCTTAGSCNPATGQCVNPPRPNGTACSDGNACTQTDGCQAGVCTGSNPKTCTASDQCHAAGICNPADGMCSNPPLSGTACNDGNACTQTDTCQAGTCTGTNPVTCLMPPSCRGAGTCDRTNGSCTYAVLGDGTACSDGNMCTQSDTCRGGNCVGANPVICPAPADDCHTQGTCSPNTGTCSNPNAPPGTKCDDGNACTQTDGCEDGRCAGGNPVTCTPNACQTGGRCDRDTGKCAFDAIRCAGICDEGTCDPQRGCVPKKDDTPCDDQTVCNGRETCQGGSCKQGEPLSCPLCDPNRGCVIDLPGPLDQLMSI